MLNSQTTAIRSVDSAAAEQSRELLLIDSAVADLAQLVAAVRPNVEVVILNAVDGLAQISQILSQYRGLKALHLVSHGASGRVFLGQGEAHSGPPGGLRGNFHRARRELARYPLQMTSPAMPVTQPGNPNGKQLPSKLSQVSIFPYFLSSAASLWSQFNNLK